MLPRKIFDKLLRQSGDRKISLLLGPRQSGKTTVLKSLSTELSKKSKCLFLDADVLSNYEKVSSFESALNTLKLNGYDENRSGFFYLFLDEFQKHPVLVNIMKNFYDNCQNVKIYASGSSSLAIKSQAQESLAGRKRLNEILPLDFEEFLWFRQDKKLVEFQVNANRLEGNSLGKATRELQQALKEFLVFGGYPEVVLKNGKQEKIAILDNIFDLYVKKDLIDYLKVDKALNAKKLIEFLAVNHGQKAKYDELAEKSALKYAEVKDYLEILKETYLISIATPFYTNKNKELVKIPKIYFVDPGVRNYFVKNFNELSIRGDAGFLFEGFVLSELLKKGHENIKFWQGKNKNEVDFVLEENAKVVPIEAKFKEKLKAEDFRGVNTFLEEYPKTKKAFLVSLAEQKQSKKIRSLLPYALAKEKFA